MAKFTINGINYHSSKLPLFTQLHVARKLMPIMGSILEAFKPGMLDALVVKSPVTEDGAEGGNDQLPVDATADTLRNVTIAKLLTIVGDALSHLSVEDTEFIIGSCLSVVRREQKGAWAPIWNVAANSLQYDDLHLPQIVQIAVQVVQDSLGGFFPEGLIPLSQPDA
jgi:hypothetical protein